MATYVAAPRHVAAGPDALTAEDFETASVHSATPSYVSEAPSYHSTLPPSYSEYATDQTAAAVAPTTTTSEQRPTPAISTTPRQRGLPPVPSTPAPMPSLSAFSIPTWSTFAANPARRHLHAVAQRRVAAAANSHSEPVHRQLFYRVAEEGDGERPRSRNAAGRPGSRGGPAGTGYGSAPGSGQAGGGAAPSLVGWSPSSSGRALEDPSLVGGEAARRARGERLRRERDEALALENRRWDLYMSQTNQWQDRERATFSRLRQQMDTEERKSFMRRISGRLFS